MDPEHSGILENLDANLLIGLVSIFVLLICSALISGAEVALFSLSQKDIDDVTEESEGKDQTISHLLQKPRKLFATLLIVNNFINIAIIIVFFSIKDRLFGGIDSILLKWIVEIGVVTFLILLFGEVLPKIYANKNNVKFAKIIAKPIAFFNFLLTPFNMPMRRLILFLENKLVKQKSNLSVNQLSQALELTSSEETSDEEQKILEGIVSFGNTDARQVMSPRIDVFALEDDETFEEIIPKIVNNGFSRIPVYRENIDQIEGVLYVKDLLPYIEIANFDWKSLLREPLFVPENKKLDDLLKDFQNKKSHLAVVVDEYGGTSGVITLEDIIEEIVGDISDEFDDVNSSYSQIDDKNFLFEGKINLKDFYRIVDVDDEIFESNKGEAETLAGFILEIIGSFPKKGQKIAFQKVVFTIEAVDKKRVKQIKVTLDV
ncbi:gliding motility-associated protein GldE [Flavobacterium orientale]|uniref:Hemolysin n=1 Tax=Flavobacterium orientale TaxID=1756020 RepID=A0A916Y7H7_9FLAO|nr:gliding motility-associated protein GldE [Flavobacterium orientale]GGD34072.1 hemolysin [Flavobacterium orientale]